MFVAIAFAFFRILGLWIFRVALLAAAVVLTCLGHKEEGSACIIALVLTFWFLSDRD